MFHFRSQACLSPSPRDACGLLPRCRAKPSPFPSSRRSHSVPQPLHHYPQRGWPLSFGTRARNDATSRRHTGFLESVSKRFLGEWLSGLSDDEGEIADRTRIERPPQDGQDRQRDRDHPLAFFSSQRRNTIAHMLQTYVVRATASRRMSRLYVATGLCSASVYAYAGPRWRGGWVHRGHFRGRW